MAHHQLCHLRAEGSQEVDKHLMSSDTSASEAESVLKTDTGQMDVTVLSLIVLAAIRAQVG